MTSRARPLDHPLDLRERSLNLRELSLDLFFVIGFPNSRRSAATPHESGGMLKKSVVHEDNDIDITPMIDCVFLLLIFFIVTSKVGSTAGVELPAAEYGAAVSLNNAVIVTIDAAEDGAAVIYKGPTVDEATRITVSDLEEQEQQIANYIEARMAESPTPTAVVVQAAGKLKHREVGRVLKAIGQVESDIETLHLAVMQRASAT